MVMQQLFYPNEIRSMEELDLGDAIVKDNELKMAVQLAQMGAADEFHPENYRDEVAERTRALIQRKIEGEEITSNFVEEPKAQVIDLMEALKRSLAKPSAKSAPAAAKGSGPRRIPEKAEAKKAAPRASAQKVAKSGSRSR
jgi:DNA end-binding protein Ku